MFRHLRLLLTELSPQVRRDLAMSFAIGVAVLLFFHADHLVSTYTGFDDPYWLLHLAVDGSYIFVYAGLAFVGLRGWRLWRRRR